MKIISHVIFLLVILYRLLFSTITNVKLEFSHCYHVTKNLLSFIRLHSHTYNVDLLVVSHKGKKQHVHAQLIGM